MDDQDVPVDAAETGKGYLLSGKIMLSAIIVLFVVVVFMVGLHLYSRWYLIRLRRRQLERRRQRRGVVVFAGYRRPTPAEAPDRGLEVAVINSLPYYRFSATAAAAAAECAVCLSEFEQGDILRLLPKCNHSFHIDCIDMWFRSHSTCPLCRAAVKAVVEVIMKVPRPIFSANGSDPGTSSGDGACATCRQSGGSETASCGGRRKGLESAAVRIEVPPRRPELEGELNQSSPSGRLMYLKRILSMGRKSPAGGGATAAGTSGGGAELDLESGSGSGEAGRVENAT